MPKWADVIDRGCVPTTRTEVLPTDLLGVWQLDRRLVDRRAGRFGRVTGQMELTLVDGDVRWTERGELLWGGERIEVSRVLKVTSEDGRWFVRFEDGRPFHPWLPGESVVHPCGEDTYRGLIHVNSALDRMRILWDVTGDTKEQRLVTRCHRLISKTTLFE